MCKNKYNSYMVKIMYLNGDTEVIDYKEKDARSYKQVLNLYKETKENYLDTDTCATIQFCGKIDNNTKLEIMFEKEIITEDKFIKEEGERIAELTAYQALQNLNKAIADIEKVKARSNNGLSTFDKAQDVLLHSIENGMKNVTMLEKIEIYDKLKKLRNDRRINKDTHTLIEHFQENLKRSNVNYSGIQKEISKTLRGYNMYIAKNKHDNLSVEQNKNIADKMCQSVKYRSFKERDITMLRLQKIYAKLTDDVPSMSIFCYNKCV